MYFIDPRCLLPRRGRCAALSGAVALLLVACAAPEPPPRPRALPAPVLPAAPDTTPARPEPAIATSWDAYRRQAALKLVAANPGRVYTGQVVQPLLAIPVLDIELEADGSIRSIVVRRVPSQARDTTQLAIDAVRRAAPFGAVTRLPRPWAFTEVFLFDEQRRFKPRTLDE